jgi:hypothetical protein
LNWQYPACQQRTLTCTEEVTIVLPLLTNCCEASGGVKNVQYPDRANGIDLDSTFLASEPYLVQ